VAGILTFGGPLEISLPGATDRHAITEALGDVRNGAPGALDRLVPLVYGDLARIAHRQLRLEANGHTFATADLVHETYLRLVDQTRAQWNDRVHFFAVAAHVMRRVLVDHARRHHAARRGGPGRRAVSLEALELRGHGALTADQRADVLVGVDDALERLATLDPRQARVVECRFFGGMTEPETAEALGVTERTVARDWVKARGWLYQELSDDDA
jgi:RNA polymerase sigma factor (TIGR02999 family)